MGDGVLSGPHEFKPVRFWDRWRYAGRCRHCMATKGRHPMKGWVEARAYGVRKPPVIDVPEYFR